MFEGFSPRLAGLFPLVSSGVVHHAVCGRGDCLPHGKTGANERERKGLESL